MWEELENALAWSQAAPGRWVTSAKQDLTAAAEWIWVVIQGDFADEQSTAQVVTGTVVSMIPFVDQICDVRDVVANCKKVNSDSSDKWAWVALTLTLIGLFPTLGSLAKGCFKIMFAYGRKYTLRAGKAAVDGGMWQASKPFVEAGIKKLNEFLARPEVRKALAALRWDNPYKELAKLARKLAGELNVGALLAAFDKVLGPFKELIDLVQRFGTTAMQTQAGQLLQTVAKVRQSANAQLADVLKPVQGWVNKLARRLEVESDMNCRAYTNAINPHHLVRPSLDAEIAVLKLDPPGWVKVQKAAPKKPIEDCPEIVRNYPDISKTGKRPLRATFDTFHTLVSKPIPPGTVLYRVVDPGSFDNSVCWMSKQEFEALKSKAEWRERFAVWAHWNGNGEFVTYTVPPGKPLLVWEGETASQLLRDSTGNVVKADAKGNLLWTAGGGRQIVLDPNDLDKAFVGKRQPTGWGYGSLGESVDMVGVPTLKNHWTEAK